VTPIDGKKRLVKLLGPTACWRDGRPSSPERREVARQDAADATAKYHALLAERDVLRDRLLSDPTYVRLVEETAAAKKDRDVANGEARRYRLMVGTNNGMFFSVEAEGDNWTDVIRKLEAIQEKSHGAR
jgi:hypothetical protein